MVKTFGHKGFKRGPMQQGIEVVNMFEVQRHKRVEELFLRERKHVEEYPRLRFPLDICSKNGKRLDMRQPTGKGDQYSGRFSSSTEGDVLSEEGEECSVASRFFSKMAETSLELLDRPWNLGLILSEEMPC